MRRRMRQWLRRERIYAYKRSFGRPIFDNPVQLIARRGVNAMASPFVVFHDCRTTPVMGGEDHTSGRLGKAPRSSIQRTERAGDISYSSWDMPEAYRLALLSPLAKSE